MISPRMYYNQDGRVFHASRHQPRNVQKHSSYNTRRSVAVFTYTISVFRVLQFLHLLMNPCVPTSVRTIDLNIRLFVAVCKLLKNNTLKKKIQSDFKNFVHTLNFIPSSPTLKTFLKHVVKVHQHFSIETLNALLKKYV